MTIPSPGPADKTPEAEQLPPAGNSEARAGKAARRARGSSAVAEQSRGSGGAKSWKSADDWGVFRTVVIAVGVLIAGIGIYYLVTGTGGVAQTSGGAVNTSLESQSVWSSAPRVQPPPWKCTITGLPSG